MRNVLLGVSASALVLGLLTGCVGAQHPASTTVASLQPPSSTASKSAETAATWNSADATITVGTGAHTLDVYVDPLCPYCAEFDQAQEDTIKRAIDAGNIRLIIHPLVFLDRASKGTAYSTRAASVLVATAQQRPSAVLDVMNDLFEHQPAEGTRGVNDATLRNLAKRHNVDARHALSDKALARVLKQATSKAFTGDDAITGTPTARLDGNAITADLYSSDFATALNAVRD